VSVGDAILRESRPSIGTLYAPALIPLRAHDQAAGSRCSCSQVRYGIPGCRGLEKKCAPGTVSRGGALDFVNALRLGPERRRICSLPRSAKLCDLGDPEGALAPNFRREEARESRSDSWSETARRRKVRL